MSASVRRTWGVLGLPCLTLACVCAFLLVPKLLAQDTTAPAGKGEPLIPSMPKVHPAPAGPETLYTRNGSRLNGRFLGVENGRLVFDDSQVGRISVSSSQVADMHLPGSATAYYQYTRRHDVAEGRIAWLETPAGGQLMFWPNKEGTGTPEPVDPSNLYKLQRDSFRNWVLGGRASFSLTSTDGNSQQLIYGGDTELRFTHPWHSAYVKGNGAFAKSRAQRIIQRAYGETSYTFQFMETFGAFIRETVEHNDFRNLRAGGVMTAGLIGQVPEFFKPLVWSLEGGISHTRNDFKRRLPDQDFAGMNVGTNATLTVSALLRLSGQSRYNVSLENLDDFTLRNEVSVFISPLGGLVVSATFQHDHDSTPPGSLERNDYRLIFSAGYAF